MAPAGRRHPGLVLGGAQCGLGRGEAAGGGGGAGPLEEEEGRRGLREHGDVSGEGLPPTPLPLPGAWDARGAERAAPGRPTLGAHPRAGGRGCTPVKRRPGAPLSVRGCEFIKVLTKVGEVCLFNRG